MVDPPGSLEVRFRKTVGLSSLRRVRRKNIKLGGRMIFKTACGVFRFRPGARSISLRGASSAGFPVIRELGRREHLMKLLVDKDWGSSSLWVPSSSGGWASCDHHSFDLPQQILDRCDYMSDWFETFSPESDLPEPDWESYSAYILALAIDLKRHYQDAARLYVRKGRGFAEVTGVFSDMVQSSL